MINVSLTMEMASDSALFGRGLMFPSRSIRGTHCAWDVFRLQKRFVRDPSVSEWLRERDSERSDDDVSDRHWTDRFSRSRFAVESSLLLVLFGPF